MAVSWRAVEVKPSDLQKTLEEMTNNRWRILSVGVTPDTKYESDIRSPGTFTIVGYRVTREDNRNSRQKVNE